MVFQNLKNYGLHLMQELDKFNLKIKVIYCKIYRSFAQLHVVEIFLKVTVSAYFWENRPKLCRNCVFPQHFHNSKLGETVESFTVILNEFENNIYMRFNINNKFIFTDSFHFFYVLHQIIQLIISQFVTFIEDTAKPTISI